VADDPIGRDALHLNLLMGDQLARPVPADVAAALLSAQITATAAERSGFQLAFDLTKNGPIAQRYLPDRFFHPKTRVVMTTTLRGATTVVFDGVITRQEVGSSNRPGQSTLTVTGEDLTLLMDLDERAQGFPNLGPAARAEQILRNYAGYGVDAQVIREQIDQPAQQDDRIDYQSGTDLQYLNELAQANGYTFYLNPGPEPGRSTAYWGPQVRTGTRQHALTVNSDAQSTVDQLTFAFDGLAREEPTALVQDPATRNVTGLPQPPIDPLRPPLARDPTAALKHPALRNTAKLGVQQASAELLAQAATSADAISGSGSLDVTKHGYVLRPRELVGVRGAGVAYDGDYYVSSVTHTLRPGVYTQNFTISREGMVARTDTVRL
jgi:hypothetical protein